MTDLSQVSEHAALHLRLVDNLLSEGRSSLQDCHNFHAEIVAADGGFYPHLAAWYFDRGDHCDHKVMFLVHLALGGCRVYRDTGLALLHRLPAEQVVRVVDFIHGYKSTRRLARPVCADAPRGIAVSRPTLIGRLNRFFAGTPVRRETPAPLPTLLTESHGLFRNLPRSLRTEIARYLHQREADPAWFDSSVSAGRDALKRLYALNHIKPGERAQRILFEEKLPADSTLCGLRQLANAKLPAEQTKAILAYAIPYAQAAAVLKQMTPTVLLTFIEQMSPEEVFANVASLAERGAMDNAYLKARVDRKVSLCKTAEVAVVASAVGRSPREVIAEILEYPLPRRQA